MSELDTMTDEDISALKRDNERLRAIVDKLPKDGRGQSIAPGTELVDPEYPELRNTAAMIIAQDFSPANLDQEDLSKYFTREAAEVARDYLSRTESPELRHGGQDENTGD